VSYLIYASTTTNERVYKLQPGINTLGRELDSTIVLLDNTLSRRHAQINVTANGIFVVDCNSSNHTFVNKVQIDACQLRDGDLLGLAEVEFRFVEDLTPAQSQWLVPDRAALGENIKQVPLPENSVQIQELVNISPRNAAVSGSGISHQQQTVNKLKILLEVSKQLCLVEDPDRLLQKILELIFQIVRIDRAAILLVDPHSQKLELKATKSRDNLMNVGDFYSHKIVNLTYQSGDAIVTEDARSDLRFQNSVSIIREDIMNCMCVPLRTYTTVMGVLYVHNSLADTNYTYEDLEFLSALATQAAVAIHMFRESHSREQKLKQQVLELQIQIDRTKKDNEVAEIVGLDSFQNLLNRAENLRRKQEPN
jgi:adenylate cyclase